MPIKNLSAQLDYKISDCHMFTVMHLGVWFPRINKGKYMPPIEGENVKIDSHQLPTISVFDPAVDV